MKKQKPNLINLIITGVYALLVLAVAGFYIYFQFIDKPDRQLEHYCEVLNDSWVWVHEDGTREPISTPVYLDVKDGEPVTLEYVLPAVIPNDYYLCVNDSRNLVLYIDDQVRKVYYADEKDFPGAIVKTISMFVKLCPEDAGKTVRIVRDDPVYYNGRMVESYIGNGIGIVSEKIREGIVPMVFATLLFFICAIIGIVGLVYYIVSKKEMLLSKLAFAIALVAAWFAFDSPIYQFVFDNYYVDGTTSYLVCMLAPVPFFAYLDKMMKERYHKIFSLLTALDLVYFGVFTTLHFAGVWKFNYALTAIDVVLGIIILAAFVILYIDTRRGYSEEYKIYLTGLIGFIVCSIVELLVINIMPEVNDGNYVLTGLYILLIFGFLQQLHDIKVVDNERLKAIAASESKSTFLASMSHEIRTPINSILGMNEMIIRESNDKQISEYAEYIEQSGRVLLGLINDILDFSKIESGKLDVVETPYNTALFFNELLTLMQERAAAKTLEAVCDFSGDIPSSYSGDVSLIRQVVTNLISNAFKYTKTGKVSLKVTSEATEIYNIDVLKFEVSDTGIGIHEEDIDKLFDSFKRMDEAQNRGIQGTGLGLAIVKNLVDSMNGEIEVKSEYGVGSTFTAIIPQTVVDRTPIGALQEAVEKANVGRPRYKELFHAPEAKVLTVDDNKINLVIVRKLLGLTKVQVDVATSGIECIHRCREKAYDLILMDHMMPEIDGIETLKMLRDDERSLNNDTKVIALTANAVSGIKEMYIKNGFTDYISKPIEPKNLEECLLKHLPEYLIEEAQ